MRPASAAIAAACAAEAGHDNRDDPDAASLPQRSILEQIRQASAMQPRSQVRARRVMSGLN